uniref:DDE Tnp4 domain-containing protein n=1 Tax=Chenopodium quinoa TaxID=63459 RepID=A0A803LA63_CHEQI
MEISLKPNSLASKMFQVKYGASPVTLGYAGGTLIKSWIVLAAKSMVDAAWNRMKNALERTRIAVEWAIGYVLVLSKGMFQQDYVGALDGTHINAVVSDDDGVAYRGRSGKKTWNVLASCSFDRLFTFINVGFEGSAHDITVWNHCLTVPEFRFPHPPP